MAWHKVAQRNEIPTDKPIEVRVGKRQIALYDYEGEIYATDNICTHAYACLHTGYYDDGTIECPLHQGVFDVKTGEPLEGPVDEPLQTFEVKIEEGEVWIDV
ncbi:Rieske (2Fe-2S) protein [Aquibaculum sediminis]|uniref:Rieske (2Fe-2S) protein n=1 Tax=Aquibaculum sediminis TaxID=3231907 RepID=UPI0034541CA6